MLSGLETKSGAVAVRVLRSHGLHQLPEPLCCAHAGKAPRVNFEFRGSLLNRCSRVRCLGAQPYGLASDLVDVPARRLRRFWFLRHARSIGRKVSTRSRLTCDWEA